MLNTTQLNKLIQLLLRKIETPQGKNDTIIQLQCLSIIAKSIGNKLSPYLSQIIPLLNNFCQTLKADESVDDDNELTETALSTLEAIFRKCPLEVNEYVQLLLATGFKLCEYDPNYIYNDDEDDEEMKSDGEDEGWGDDDFSDNGGGFADCDDDTSWKVRRAAIGIIDTIIKTRPDRAKEII